MILIIFFGFFGVSLGVMLFFILGYLILKFVFRLENVMVVYVFIVVIRVFSIG